MNKCEHGERITQFCATDCCVWKQAAGCESCMKKYHNHMGTTVFLNEQEVLAIVRKYTMDSNIKPKCRLLQEAIYAYFNLIKGELTSSLDAACKNIINQIGYPYLYANGTLSTYKRLKNKQYKKLMQKDFKSLYELTQKISDRELVSEEAKIYINEMKLTEDLMNGLEDTVKRYETLIKKYHPAFAHDSQHIAKINQIFKHLHNDSPKTSHSKASQNKYKEEKKSVGPVYQFKQKQPSPVKLQQVPASEPPSRMPAIGLPPSLVRPNYSRDVSIDKKIVKEHKFGGQRTEKQSSEKEILGKVPLIREQSERIETIRQELNNRQAEINQKKKMLMEMMKQKEESVRSDKDKSNSVENKDRSLHERKRLETKVSQPEQSITAELEKPPEKRSEISSSIRSSALQTKSITDKGKSITQESELTFQDRSDVVQRKQLIKTVSNEEDKRSMSSSKSPTHSQQQLEQQSLKAINDIKNYAFTRLPVQQIPAPQLNRSQIERRLIVIPTASLKEGIPQQSQSPILKKKNIIDRYRQATRGDTVVERKLFEEREEETDRLLDLIPIYHKKTETLLELKDNQQKSLALLLKSLALKAEEAVVYLQQSILYADNNLSAAEYLSFLYLELNRPSDCLKLCNRMIDRIENSSEPEELLLIVNNNKAAALNVLGRYSESIVLLERCLRCRQKDYFYKNLGDAYFSISMYEKAIYNYEKALRSNDQYDQAHYNLAVCLYVQQNYHNARLAIQKAIEINSANEHYHELLSNIDTRINHY